MLAGQTISESNILEYMAAIEQRAVDTISEYIMLNQREGAGNKYPTPGPSSPMRTGKVHVEINESAIVDEADNDGGFVSQHADDHDGMAQFDQDSKPIDLALFKERLRKRKSMNSNARGHSGGRRRGNVSGDGRMGHK
jgi:hypothetical protein